MSPVVSILGYLSSALGHRDVLFSASLIHRIEFAPQRELYFLALYRILEAGLIAALVFSPVSLLVDPGE